MSLRAYIPTLPAISREALAVLAGTIIAAVVISRFPQLQAFVSANSLTVRTDQPPPPAV